MRSSRKYAKGSGYGKYLVTADIHMRPNTKGLDEVFFTDLGTLYDKHRCDGVIVIGDLLDQKRPSIEYMIRVDDLLQRFGRPLYWLKGNHEAPDPNIPGLSCLYFLNRWSNTYWEQGVKSVDDGNSLFYFLPWQPSKRLKDEAQQFAVHAQMKENVGKKKILFAHVGLKEGEVGEDCRVHQEISIKDLVPDVYDFVLLGDYHRHQFLGENSLYLGAPFPKSFNDTNSVGVWLLDLNGPEVTLESLSLPSIYPQYRSWTIKDRSNLVLVGYDNRDVNRIVCEVALLGEVTNLYPDARVVGEEFNPVMDRGRLEGIENQEAEKIFLAYLKSRGIKNKELKELGMYYVQAAKKI
jgi:DNA repair exonuclease SbcCD nuclease subunit